MHKLRIQHCCYQSSIRHHYHQPTPSLTPTTKEFQQEIPPFLRHHPPPKNIILGAGALIGSYGHHVRHAGWPATQLRATCELITLNQEAIIHLDTRCEWGCVPASMAKLHIKKKHLQDIPECKSANGELTITQKKQLEWYCWSSGFWSSSSLLKDFKARQVAKTDPGEADITCQILAYNLLNYSAQNRGILFTCDIKTRWLAGNIVSVNQIPGCCISLCLLSWHCVAPYAYPSPVAPSRGTQYEG